MRFIYSSPGCISCAQAKAFLAGHNVVFNECSLAEDASAMEELIRIGCRALPVIGIDNEVSQDFNPTKLHRLLGL
jgi:glutaredoxin